ncbi:hypothetical protein ACWEN3_46675, partial [Streptomyces sp. NPDC004561]
MDGVTATGVRARAHVVARADGRGGTALPVLEGEGPLALRRTRASGTEARVWPWNSGASSRNSTPR